MYIFSEVIIKTWNQSSRSLESLKKQIFFTISVFWESKNFFLIKTNFSLDTIYFQNCFSRKFFSPLKRWNCDHFFLLQIFSNSAQLAVRAFCPKWTPLTSALVKVIDVAGLTRFFQQSCPRQVINKLSAIITWNFSKTLTVSNVQT